MPRKTATTKKTEKKEQPVPETIQPQQLVIPAIPVADDDDDVVISEERFADERYFQAIGRRKESIARVRLYTKKSSDQASEDRALITVNGKDYREYFLDNTLAVRVEAPLRKLKSLNRFKATVMVRGGGSSGQADAVRLGIARALEQFDTNFRKKLKKSGFLTRDPRIKERRKYGLKKARKAPQWSKR